MNKIKNYGFCGVIRIFFELLYTKMFFRNCRLIRRPIFIRGKQQIDFGKNFTTGRFCRIEAYSKKKVIEIGENCQINDNVHIAGIEKIKIGKNVLIASKVFITDHNHGEYNGKNQSSPLENPAERKLVSNPVLIEDNVWIGEFCSILPGVKIGKGSIIGSNSVVLNDIPPYTIAAGAPAKAIKKYDFLQKEWIKIEKNCSISN